MDLTTLTRFQIAPGYDPAKPDTWVFEDRTQDVDHVGGGIAITGGRADEISQVDTSYATLRLDNAGGHYCTRNPNGRWFGRLARNCPARWGTISGAEAFAAAATNGWGVPDVGTSWTHTGTLSEWSASGGTGQKVMPTANIANSAILNGANARNGDATVVIMAPAVATGGSLIYGIQARYTSSSDHILFQADLGPSGVVVARIARQFGGSLTTLSAVTAAITYSAGQRLKVRTQWDGQDLRLRIWPEANAEPATWTTTATDTVCTGSGFALRPWRTAGNTNSSPVFHFDNLEVLAVEIVGTVPEWPVRWDPTATVSWAPIQIAGVTRRVIQGKAALRSPLYRQLIAQKPHGYWPLEDDSGATQGAAATPRTSPATQAEASFGSTDAPPGAAASVSLSSFSSNSRITGGIRVPVNTDTGYAAMAFFKLGSGPSPEQPLFRFFATGRVFRWQISISSTAIFATGIDVDGATVTSNSALHLIDVTKWFSVQLETEEFGLSTNWSLIWQQVGVGNSFFAISGSYTGTADRLTAWTATAPADSTQVCHVWLGPNTLPYVDSTFLAVAAGYAGELASARVARLAKEAGIPIAVEAGASEPMGTQPMGEVMDLIRQVEAADMGVLYESGAGLAYRPRGARYNRPVDMTLSMAPNGDIGDAPEPTDDDLRVRNRWTVQRINGSESTAEDPAHIALQGLYPDNATINVQTDARLDDHAAWRVHLGTWGEMRWPQITLDLTDRPDLLNLWRGRPFGPRITISGVPAQGPVGADVDLIVEGFSQEITSHSWRVTLNCSPARPWDVATYDGAVEYGSELTSTASTLTASSGAGQSLMLTFPSPQDGWSSTSVPYQIQVNGGEVMTVTAMGAISGTAPNLTQVATVTRAANGISVAHAVGESVQIYTEPRYAL